MNGDGLFLSYLHYEPWMILNLFNQFVVFSRCGGLIDDRLAPGAIYVECCHRTFISLEINLDYGFCMHGYLLLLCLTE